MGLRVYLWHDRHASDQYRDGVVSGTFAAAVERREDLRAVCRAAGVLRPSRPQPARAGDDVVQIALAHPGTLLFLDREATGRADPHWRVLPAQPDS